MFRHIAPNVFAPYLIMLTAFLGQAILLEASLSFLGLGVFEPTPSWGLMLRGAGMQFLEQAPWLAIAPASRSAWRCSASICSATRCGTRSTRGCGPGSDAVGT